MNSPNSNGSDYLNPPNFDHLLSRGQRCQQQQESVHRSQRRRGSARLVAESTLTNYKPRGFSASFADDRVIGIGNKVVRIHPTEMQIYLRSVVQSLSPPDDMAMMKNTISKQVSNMTADGDNKGDLPSDSCDDLLRSAAVSSPSPHAASASPPPQSAATVDPSSKKINRQKNDKAVEVYKETSLIARFRTQTECARYLRATPEAVSYHCSKGGGCATASWSVPSLPPLPPPPLATTTPRTRTVLVSSRDRRPTVPRRGRSYPPTSCHS